MNDETKLECKRKTMKPYWWLRERPRLKVLRVGEVWWGWGQRDASSIIMFAPCLPVLRSRQFHGHKGNMCLRGENCKGSDCLFSPIPSSHLQPRDTSRDPRSPPYLFTCAPFCTIDVIYRLPFSERMESINGKQIWRFLPLDVR